MWSLYLFKCHFFFLLIIFGLTAFCTCFHSCFITCCVYLQYGRLGWYSSQREKNLHDFTATFGALSINLQGFHVVTVELLQREGSEGLHFVISSRFPFPSDSATIKKHGAFWGVVNFTMTSVKW